MMPKSLQIHHFKRGYKFNNCWHCNLLAPSNVMVYLTIVSILFYQIWCKSDNRWRYNRENKTKYTNAAKSTDDNGNCFLGTLKSVEHDRDTLVVAMIYDSRSYRCQLSVSGVGKWAKMSVFQWQTVTHTTVTRLKWFRSNPVCSVLFSPWWSSLGLLVACRSSPPDWPGDHSLHRSSRESSRTTVESRRYELEEEEEKRRMSLWVHLHF